MIALILLKNVFNHNLFILPISNQFQADLDGNIYYSIKNTDKTWIVNSSHIMLYTEDPNSCYLHSHPFDYTLPDVEQSFQQVFFTFAKLYLK